MISIYKYGDVPNSEIYKRENISQNVEGTVKEIIDNVIKNGDRALFEYCEKFDKVKLSTLEVTPEEIDEAFSSVEKKFIDVLKESAENIRNFHKRQVANSFFINEKDGVVTGQRVTPIEKVGLYVPGGTAAYPSTVLMDSIPAKIAGCKEIVMVTPPMTSGKVNPVILAAAKIAGVDRIFKVGGAQAVAALAYGTDTVPKVDKIVGPGNAYVAEAKKQVFGKVSIDMIAGPSEILVVADRTSIPKNIAADMLSQAEHDKMAAAILVTDSKELVEKVQVELERQLAALPRTEIAGASVDNYGSAVVLDSIDEAIEFSNIVAPEHLELALEDPMAALEKVKNAGSVFLGEYAPEPLGDYFAGPNHVLPTNGTARFASPLSVDTFVKKSQYLCYTKDALRLVKDDVIRFAESEGLGAHANSVRIRFENE